MSEITVLEDNKLVPVEGEDLQLGQTYYLLTAMDEGDKPLSTLSFYEPESPLKTGDEERLNTELANQEYRVGRVVIVENDTENGVVRTRNPSTSVEQGLIYGEGGWQYEDVNNPGHPIEIPDYSEGSDAPAVAANPGHSQLSHADGLSQVESAARGSHSDTTPRDFSKVDGATTSDDRNGQGNKVLDHGDGSSEVPQTNPDAPAADDKPAETVPTEENTKPENVDSESNPASSDNSQLKDVQPVVGGGSQFSQSGNNTKSE